MQGNVGTVQGAEMAAEQRPINYDRGVTIKARTGYLEVAMYKDEPGVYYAPNGRLVTEEHARDVGFDVAAMRKLRDRKMYIKEMAQKYDDAQEEATKHWTVIASEGGIEARDYGGDRHLLIDRADNYDLSAGRYLTKEEALAALKRFKGPQTEDGK